MWTCDVERPWWSLLLWWTINNVCALMHHLACRVQVRWQGKPDLLSALMYCAEEFSEEWTRWLGVDGPTLAYWMLELNVRGEADALAEKCKNSDKVYFFTVYAPLQCNSIHPQLELARYLNKTARSEPRLDICEDRVHVCSSSCRQNRFQSPLRLL